MVKNQWKKENNSLVKTFTFKGFVEAVDFVNKIVPLVEKVQHHPDIEIFSYKKVKVKLTTHEKDKVTARDTSLSKKIDKIK
ncbi:MAG: pterin-4-alpha-carbinolamine dehydratase [Candidatus Nomurabacteria bacterium GW2011_GWF2_35_66]|uniref:4a-hydroxytetrahydrobiopterin dehydratase n=1 Tax=Candidatus Nomurabacteria bacterium GW2011_GWE1_35_16 TaxID=1618761 RepID=A0A0G0BA42_9BACT|nr:MAG: pterin-4-alpha-carbinolamine dehydratase [Candidatus Nomurabacteria bacterium GW2011_GWF1_34_20]KKP63173.1 MAG: pterin-4-alpha-carbinolamine dehydratase [Candidatus Nomurabacteria bacterium GW2011_GWE2_34_25]KKP66298.1 MAG: pterin-4-alpha-carbinolamine dehydratase [Candidatus Nomurabacteria bacterium GW2011_GWE1_35_16]KKP83259.1 MAG: pterin-4-alpha-carbinolamine dehydratase [Candidatus Nomurabacteria bacterium GW2011_GWF2_35_66]HAE36726.1 4a-hydroxytetrahydrobiopterin dehydratase [Candi